jgi:hypothetical protein
MNAANPPSVLRTAPGEGTGPTSHDPRTLVPPRIEASWTWSLVLKLLVISIGAIAVVIIYSFNPAQYGFYPRCALYETTGLLCPGCGSLRALHQLLHGHLAEAFRLNALLVLSLPVFAWLSCRVALRKFQHRPVLFIVHPFWMWSGLAVLLLFAIGRNLR